MQILKAQLDAKQKGKPYALATVVKVVGSTPRGVGVKMLVYEDGSTVGTVGGGYIEQAVIKDAVESIKSGISTLQEYENSYGLGPNCGGLATIYIDVEAGMPMLVVCGLGHVGAAVAKAARVLNWNIHAVDTREEEIILQNAEAADQFTLVSDFRSGVRDLQMPPGAFYLISTYSHDTDAEALAGALEKQPAYVGMMGSPGKIKAVREKLMGYGFTPEQLDFVHTPVGLNIGGSTPPEIAISIIAEMQMVRYKGSEESLVKLGKK
ncbi:XdhC/CoxI family protein [Eubacteriales bacterium OttesenSCG-928-M02]|nr:XdhC/CoxI family protein [Eubacteriales bacterium OttesenSCG-928-M02]